MNVIGYLLKKQLKNYFVSLKKNPAKIAAYVFIIFFLGLTFVLSLLDKEEAPKKMRDINELLGIAAGFFMFIFSISLYSGLERGASFFKMSDVNLLFTAPISSKKVLMYGIIKQMGLNLFISIFILYQIPTLNRIYGINGIGCLAIFIGYLTLLIACQVCSMALYMFSNGNPKRKRRVKIVFNSVLAAAGALLIYQVAQGEDLIGAALHALRILDYVPFVGWIKDAIGAVIQGEIHTAIIYSLVTAAALAAILLSILKSNADYYEDVLTTTEYMDEVTSAMQKGKPLLDSQTKLKGEKVKSFGLKRGRGASTIFYKQMLEAGRSGKIGINVSSAMQVVIALGIGFFLNKAKELDDYTKLLIILGIMTYMQILMSQAERWTAELKYHYIYLLPQPGVIKMFFASLEGLIKAALEGCFMFLPIGVLVGVNPLFILLCILARISFQMLFTGLSVLFQRMFGSSGNAGLLMMLYLLLAFVFAAPGIITGVIIGAVMYSGSGAFLSYIAAIGTGIAYNIIFAFVVGLFSNQLFMQMELNTKA